MKKGYIFACVAMAGLVLSACVGQNEPTPQPQVPEGVEMVDLGLPSGLKWANMNIGATSPEDNGDYFAWGEVYSKSLYNYSTYKWCKGERDGYTKYCLLEACGKVDDKQELELADDAARANWGGQWRMPTKAEVNELMTTCRPEWNWVDGKLMLTLTGPNNKSIVLPGAGYVEGNDTIYSVASSGRYWSSSLAVSAKESEKLEIDHNDPMMEFFCSGNACSFGFAGGSWFVNQYNRVAGLSIRPVCE